MNKIHSNPTSRSPSRVASHRAHSQPSTPGLIHLSPAMLQPLQQQHQQHQPQAGKRSKGANQRTTSKNSRASSSRQQQHAVADEGTATGSDADIFTDVQGQEAGKPRTPTPSHQNKRERRQQRQQEYSADSAVEDGSPATGRHAEALGIQRATTPRRPQHKRGQSQATFAAPDHQEEQSYTPSNIDQASLLSKSAPTTSFLTRRTERLQKQQSSNNNTIRSSNSADEWDMPMTANGNDALTWQQQSLGRKASNPTKKQNKNGKKAGTFDKADVGAVKPHTPSGISIMAPQQQTTISSRSLPASSHPTPVPTPSAAAPLTWQQELFQRSGPSTPSSQLFAALEEGHSGAHPAKETRSRSSPTKARQAQQKSAYQSDGFSADDANLEASMSGLALNPSKKVVNNTKQGKKGHSTAAAPVAIPGSVPKHHHYTRSAAKQHNQRNAASDSDADNSVEEETANLSFGEEPTRAIPIAASPTKSSLYAGPKFHNSPSAGQLPTPRLAAFLNRNKESSPLPSGEVLAA